MLPAIGPGTGGVIAVLDIWERVTRATLALHVVFQRFDLRR